MSRHLSASKLIARSKRGLAILSLSLLLLPAAPASGSSSKGLMITPVRDFLSVDAGDSATGSVTVANTSDEPINVTLSVKQFAVADYTYNYTFNQPGNDWLHLALTAVTLQPDERRQIPFSLDVPADSKPGGQYYTLFASARLASGRLSSTVQATDLLYVTVGGELTRTSRLQSAHAPRLAFSDIPYDLQALNTGNVHFFAYGSGQLHGWLTKPADAPNTYLLMPGKLRKLTGTVAAPVLPGVYKLTFGYRTDQGQTVQTDRWVVFIPPWFIALSLAVLLFAGKLSRRRKRPGKSKQPDTDPSNHANPPADQ